MVLDLIFVVTLAIRKATLLAYCAGVAELADAQDLKSWGPKGPCRFNSGPRHEGAPGVEFVGRLAQLVRALR